MATSSGEFVFEAHGERGILIGYSFEAEPEAVFVAWHDTSGMGQWYGPETETLVTAEQDFRVGGEWKYATRNVESGEVTELYGVYREIEQGRRVVNTEIFAGMPDFETTVECVFEPEGGGTRMTAVVTHPVAESRDGAMASGMEEGVRATYERFARYLATLG